MAFTLPDLPFDNTQLAPFCSKETFEYHHGKHHAGYVNKLNTAVQGSEMENMNLEELIKKSYQEKNLGVFNNAAQHFNHSFFWQCINPSASKTPGSKTQELINQSFQSLDNFKAQFSDTAAKLFGSGWAWVVLNNEQKLEILALKDADTPIIFDKKPIMTLDVWEHAYYIDHRNARPNYIQEFWQFINWDNMEKLLS